MLRETLLRRVRHRRLPALAHRPPFCPLIHDTPQRGFSVPYLRALRAKLDAGGFVSTRLVCGDLPRSFECAAAVAGDASLKAIVAVLGSHQPSAFDGTAAGTGLPMINSEAHYNVADGSDWATAMNHG